MGSVLPWRDHDPERLAKVNGAIRESCREMCVKYVDHDGNFTFRDGTVDEAAYVSDGLHLSRGVWTECWRISFCLNGRQRKWKDNPTHAATHAVSHRGRLRERLQTAMHENGAQIENRSRAHAGTNAVSHRGQPRARTQMTTHGTGVQTNLKRTHDTSHAMTHRGRPRARTQMTTRVTGS